MTRRDREARRWWRQAKRDFESAEINAQHDRYEVACFLSQQAGEKALKAFLYAQGESPVLGHLLVELVKRSAEYDKDLGALREPAKLLDVYYIPSRYPNGLSDSVSPFEFFEAVDSERALGAARVLVDSLAGRLPAGVTASE